MRIQIYPGAQAFSAFRLEKLLSELCATITDLKQINARFIHFVLSKENLADEQVLKLNQLLDYGDPSIDLSNALNFWTVPRLGTRSPWSTKATDIVKHCGLDMIQRIERGIHWQCQFVNQREINVQEKQYLSRLLSDRMTESMLFDQDQFSLIFAQTTSKPLRLIDVLARGRSAIEEINQELGLALSADEVDFLFNAAKKSERNFTDVELMMFSQVNSEHCRHKIFNATWKIDGVDQDHSLFSMIRNTHSQNPGGTLVAYEDNAAIIYGHDGGRFFSQHDDGVYAYHQELINLLIKVETHNHPTAISPFPGAATGSGGEIRDEGATGRGGKPKAGITGFTVSNLRLPNAIQCWEGQEHKPDYIASPLEIMLEGPIGAAAFNNEFGRPNLAGYFRTFEQNYHSDNPSRFGYHKPIMIAGGMGNIRPQHTHKNAIKPGHKIVVLGGPAMLIGLGGGAASSVASGHGDRELDFASVQRGNPEMQRRCQEVIDQCCSMGDNSPIVSIHDVGAGGLCNAVPELVHDAGLGGKFELRNILNDEPGMTPKEIWCNEAQERYVIAVSLERLSEFEAICARERCLYCVIGEATKEHRLQLTDQNHTENPYQPIDIDMNVLFGNPPKMYRDVRKSPIITDSLDIKSIDLIEATQRILNFPAVADKSFLITIGDRSITGMVCRDQMVGPWQVPVADVAVTTSGFESYTGEAMAMGERTPIAILNPPASGRMAIAESVTNLAAARINNIKQIKISANWMASAGHEGQDAALYETVKAVGLELCPALGIAIPVGKDSMSMRTVWQDQDQNMTVAAPVSLISTAFAAVDDVRLTLTPQLQKAMDSRLVLIDLGQGQNRLGASALCQVYNKTGSTTADLDDPKLLTSFFQAIQELNQNDLILAYHDRSDGGLYSTFVEMAFAGRCGLKISIDGLGQDPVSILFNEELGAVIQINKTNQEKLNEILSAFGLKHCTHDIGSITTDEQISISYANKEIYKENRIHLHRLWSQTSWRIQKQRDNPKTAQQEYDRLLDSGDPGLFSQLSFKQSEDISAPYINLKVKPKIAILREQGVNSHVEMAAAFDRAGFIAIDVHMSDLIAQNISLGPFKGLVACGGFSFGDVLGAGQGWAKSILFNRQLEDSFAGFFERLDTFSLGVCNGCQMMSGIKALIPGAKTWPTFVRNLSEQYEARQVMIEILNSPSILFKDMQESKFPVVVAHAEGQVKFETENQMTRLINGKQICLQFIDNYGLRTESYPYNPNGSVAGISALTSEDGRSTIIMPHPERVFRSVTNSWHPKDWPVDGPWMRMFRNARVWVD